MRTALRWVGAGIVLLLASSTVGYALAAGTESPASEPFVVPVGRIGDDVSYVSFERNTSDEPWQPVQSWIDGWSFRVIDHTTSLDQAAVEHDVIQVASGFYDESHVSGAVTGDGWEWQELDTLFIDLATRHGIRMTNQYHYAEFYLNGLLPNLNEKSAYTAFGPVYDFVWGFLVTQARPIEFIPYAFENQGRLLEVGQQLDPNEGHLLDSAWILREDGIELLNLRRHVVGLGEVQGQAALIVRTEGCIDLHTDTLTAQFQRYWNVQRINRKPVGTLPLLHAHVPLQSHACFASDAWMGNDPYPLLIEERVDVNATRVYERQEARSRFSSGIEPIRWGNDRGTHHYLSRNPFARFCKGGTPCEGGADWPQYSMSSAQSSVGTDPTLAQFHDWQRNHRDVHLVGLSYSEAQRWPCVPPMSLPPMETAPTWFFLHAIPKGEYFLVYSVRPSGAAGPIHCAFGPRAGPAFDASKLEKPVTTLASTLETWDKLLGESGFEPTHFGWGGNWWCSGTPEARALPAYTRPCDLRQADPQVYGADFATSKVWLSHQKEGESWADVALQLGAYDGNLVMAEDSWYRDLPASFLGPAPLENPPNVRTFGAGSRDSAAAPIIGVTGGLMALLLLAYAYPFLKFHGAQALTLIPGYAKLRRDKLLDNRIRDEIHEVVRNDPGISPPEIAKKVQAGWTTIIYHLRVLEQNGLVSSMLDARHRRFFPRDAVDWNKRAPLAALRNARTRAVYDVISQEPGIYQSEIARRVGVSQPGTAWHLDRLQRTGLIAGERSGRKMTYFPNQTAPPPYREASGVEVA